MQFIVRNTTDGDTLILLNVMCETFRNFDKKDKGLYYTPAHLAKLLVDECLPLKQYEKIDLTDFAILDPACGSGIFLVLVFKRLVQIWKLQNWEKTTNELPKPTAENLKSLLRNIYGVDKEEQAVSLAAFSLSLALCDELEPKQIINELKFDDLRETNLIEHDFFTCEKIKDKKFDLIIGNPPFVAKGVEGYSYTWEIENKNIEIPQKQLALKFLSESFPYLENKGLLCLIVKASSLLYNFSSKEYKNTLFSNYNVVQILDFTALARNKSLWENGPDVASAAIFARNATPDFTKNILHLTFRRTKATKERITFEIDDYDLHFVNRQTAIENEFIWKNNLLGGGRIKNTIDKLNTVGKLQDIFKKNLNTDLSTILSEYDFNIIRDVNETMQFFLRNGEKSKAVQPIKQLDFKTILKHYGAEFSKVLNLIYEKDNRKFRLSDVVELKNSLIATVFKYDTDNKEVNFAKNLSELNIEDLTDNKISSELSAKRIIKLYPQRDTIVFIKPNQYRYWLSLIAYRDADGCFADLVNAGF
ncbi:hypothetical protein FACS1894123_00470 [Bacteroidia bacterium]|nr:hypothetical protein FACS1894123_00470 [Bacteroidia bacterium]